MSFSSLLSDTHTAPCIFSAAHTHGVPPADVGTQMRSHFGRGVHLQREREPGFGIWAQNDQRRSCAQVSPMPITPLLC